jgi:hypothetical protein
MSLLVTSRHPGPVRDVPPTDDPIRFWMICCFGHSECAGCEVDRRVA